MPRSDADMRGAPRGSFERPWERIWPSVTSALPSAPSATRDSNRAGDAARDWCITAHVYMLGCKPSLSHALRARPLPPHA
eukprot:56466-Eustigmatos_ZCMA.PRE.1